MGYKPYQTTVLVPPRNLLTFSMLVDAFKNKMARGGTFAPNLVVETNKIVLRRNDWALTIHWQDQSYVAEESNEIARRFAINHPDFDVIASCNRMVSTAGDSDPDMKYFNDYVRVLEVFESLSDVFKFDGEKFITEYGNE